MTISDEEVFNLNEMYEKEYHRCTGKAFTRKRKEKGKYGFGLFVCWLMSFTLLLLCVVLLFAYGNIPGLKDVRENFFSDSNNSQFADFLYADSKF